MNCPPTLGLLQTAAARRVNCGWPCAATRVACSSFHAADDGTWLFALRRTWRK